MEPKQVLLSVAFEWEFHICVEIDVVDVTLHARLVLAHAVEWRRRTRPCL